MVDGFVCCGDADVRFTKSTSKPFTAALVMDETGDPGILMDRIGVEPTSLAFNSVLATQILPVPSGAQWSTRGHFISREWNWLFCRYNDHAGHRRGHVCCACLDLLVFKSD